jgi:hypothetical protein
MSMLGVSKLPGEFNSMNGLKSVAVFVGSLRKQSLTRKTALTLAEVAPANLKLDIVEIGQLALYNKTTNIRRRPPGRPFVKQCGLRAPFCSSRPNTTARFPPH